MYIARTFAALIALLCCTCTAARDGARTADIEVTLGAADQSRLGVSTIPLQAVQLVEAIDAIGRVLDVGALAQLNGELETASAAATASASETRRLKVLAADDQNASRHDLEAAIARSVSDEARLQLARSRVALEWGPGLAALGEDQRRKLVSEIAEGRAALVRVDPLEPQSAADADVHLRPDPNAPPVATESLGPAAITDLQMQTRGLLVTVHGQDAHALRPGRVLAAEIDSGRTLNGVMLPRSALVRIDGLTWAYLRRGDDEFLRREVVDPSLQNEGWFVTTGFAPGDEIVAAGAGSLLAVERGGEVVDDDD